MLFNNYTALIWCFRSIEIGMYAYAVHGYKCKCFISLWDFGISYVFTYNLTYNFTYIGTYCISKGQQQEEKNVNLICTCRY